MNSKNYLVPGPVILKQLLRRTRALGYFMLLVVVIWTQLCLAVVGGEDRGGKVTIFSPSISSAHVRLIRVANLNFLVFLQEQVWRSTHLGSSV